MKLLLATALAASFAVPAWAQPRNCGLTENVFERLWEKYGETKQVEGYDARGMVMNVFASEATGSWTVTLSAPNGRTCAIASGQEYFEIDEPAPKAGKKL